MSNRGDYYRLMCPFCQTLLTVVPEQEGTKVKCPDCFSMLDVGPPPSKKTKKPQRGGQTWTEDAKAGKTGGSAEGGLQPVADELSQFLEDDPTESRTAEAVEDEGDLKLADSFERPSIRSMYGFESGNADLLAPKKRNRGKKKTEDALEADDLPPADGIDEFPVAESDIPTLESIGTLVPESEPEAGVDAAQQRNRATRESGSRKRIVERVGQHQKESDPSDSIQDDGRRRPKFQHAELFMATVSMVTDARVLLAAGVATVLMLVGGIACEAILPVGTDTSSWEMSATLAKTGLKILFGYLPYYAGLVGLWVTAGFIFRDAAEGYSKVQRWTVAGQSEFWSTFLLFAFGFFIAGLPAAVFTLLMIPMRMLIAPLFLISAWFNRSPWMIVSTDWFSAVAEDKSQWTTVYYWFVAFAFIGFLAGLVFFMRSWVEVFAVDLLLTILGIGINVVLTLAFAAIAGWHAGAVIESLDA